MHLGSALQKLHPHRHATPHKPLPIILSIRATLTGTIALTPASMMSIEVDKFLNPTNGYLAKDHRRNIITRPRFFAFFPPPVPHRQL
jgi:hypothetical protein